MGVQDKRGFTIIEVMLFLAISGMLAATLLGGWGVMINTQRYKDSVRTLQTFLQQQYNLVYNVENGRSTKLLCDAVHGVREADAGAPRGQTDCTLLGRYIYISGGNVRVAGIVGTVLDDAVLSAETDVEAILGSKPKIISEDMALSDAKLAIPWQAQVVGLKDITDAPHYAVAIIRSPVSGLVHTYVANRATDPVLDATFIVGDNEKNDTQLCMDAGAPFSGGTMAVVLKAYASSQNFVDILGDGDNKC